MKLLVISTIKPYKGSGTGLTEYAYQLSEHLKPMLSNNDRIDFLYQLSDSKRNNIKGLFRANTSFKKLIADIPKEVRKYCFEATSPEHMAQIIEHLKSKVISLLILVL